MRDPAGPNDARCSVRRDSIDFQSLRREGSRGEERRVIKVRPVDARTADVRIDAVAQVIPSRVTGGISRLLGRAAGQQKGNRKRQKDGFTHGATSDFRLHNHTGVPLYSIGGSPVIVGFLFGLLNASSAANTIPS